MFPIPHALILFLLLQIREIFTYKHSASVPPRCSTTSATGVSPISKGDRPVARKLEKEGIRSVDEDVESGEGSAGSGCAGCLGDEVSVVRFSACHTVSDVVSDHLGLGGSSSDVDGGVGRLIFTKSSS